MTVIVVKNLTGSGLSLNSLGVPGHEIPASGQVTLTEGNTVGEIQSNTELKGHISNDNAVLIVDGTQLTKVASLNISTAVATVGTPITAGPPRKRIMFGTRMDYPTRASVSLSEIQYVQVWFNKGEKIAAFESFIEKAILDSTIKYGLYDQEDPSDELGLPRTKLAESPNFSLTGTESGEYISQSLGSSFVVPNNGYYWIALICSVKGKVRLSSTFTFNNGHVPAFWESSSGTTLPTTANGVKKKSSILYVAALLEV